MRITKVIGTFTRAVMGDCDSVLSVKKGKVQYEVVSWTVGTGFYTAMGGGLLQGTVTPTKLHGRVRLRVVVQPV